MVRLLAHILIMSVTNNVDLCLGPRALGTYDGDRKVHESGPTVVVPEGRQVDGYALMARIP
jgi:hypothetical protein